MAQPMVPSSSLTAAACLTALDGGDRHGRQQAAGEENHSVDRAEDHVQFLAAGGKLVGVAGQIDRVEEEKPAEEDQFGEEEQPHAERGAGMVPVLGLAHGIPVP